MTSRRHLILAVLLAAALGASGCSTISRLNPFKGSGGPKETATEGQRISIIQSDEVLEPAEALKGVDFALPPVTTQADWPLPGGTPEQSVENVDAGANLTVAWRRNIGQGSNRAIHVMATPVIAAGRIYTMDAEAGVSAHDARTGAEVWRANLRPNDNRRDRESFGGGVAFADGKLYVTSGYRFVAAVDAATGKVLWRTRTEEPIHAAPTVAEGRVMTVALDNSMLTFDAATGAPGWSYQALSESARILGASSPAVSGDTVVASFGSGELIALRVANGNDLWDEALSRASRTSSLSEIRDIPGRPVIYRGDVYAVSHSGVFAATDLRTGQARWTLPVVGIAAPLPAGDVVYVVSKTGQVICVSRETGQIYWIVDLGKGYVAQRRGGFLGIGGSKVLKPIWSSPLLSNNRLLLVGSSGQLVALNAKTGAVEKRVDLGAPALIGPVAAGDTVYVLTDNAELIALR
ncbi:PQQ-like beta-propeller repeat protein [Phenylobacterium sp.]|uniref:PQQ-like beta-propeller repeat protein n=1 Tax=Phenylobacterium sp. TaxID=1871053 RepID=UPI002DF3DD23|nr:PQQ-binding-like beta-propeller repeat protein [Phenylobacterium sp.]